MTRRHRLAAFAGVMGVGTLPLRAATALQPAEVSRRPACGGCGTEVERISVAGSTVKGHRGGPDVNRARLV